MIILTSLVLVWLLIGFVRTKGDNYRLQLFDKESISPLRGILSVMIIIHHLPVFYPSDFRGLLIADGWGGAICSLFFLFSGYGLVKSYLLKSENYLSRFFSRRLSKIMIPACIVMLVHFAVAQIVWERNLWSFLISFRNVFGILPHYWFICTLIIFYFVYYLAFKYVKNIYGGIIVISLATIIYYFYTRYGLKYTENWWNSIHGFAMGAFLAIIEPSMLSLWNKHKTFFRAYLSVFIIAICSYNLIGCYAYYLPAWGTIFFFFFPIMTYLCNTFMRIPNNPIMSWIGSISYEIYLVHVSVMHFLHPLISNACILFIAIIGLTTLSAWVLHLFCHYIERNIHLTWENNK